MQAAVAARKNANLEPELAGDHEGIHDVGGVGAGR